MRLPEKISCLVREDAFTHLTIVTLHRGSSIDCTFDDDAKGKKRGERRTQKRTSEINLHAKYISVWAVFYCSRTWGQDNL